MYGNTPDPVFFPSFSASLSAPEVGATVNWYNAEKGFGFVTLADGASATITGANITALNTVGNNALNLASADHVNVAASGYSLTASNASLSASITGQNNAVSISGVNNSVIVNGDNNSTSVSGNGDVTCGHRLVQHHYCKR